MQKEEQSSQSKINKEIRISLFLHLLIGVLVLIGVFTLNAIVNNLPFSPRTFAPPIFVGLISGYLIWRNKAKLIEINLNQEKIIEQRTMDLKVANEMLQEMVKKQENK